jgi:exodeoxyribonuclease VII small subunit
MTEEHTYEEATARIEEIIRRLDSGEAGLRETLDLCNEGRTLIEYCTAELEAVGRGLQELRLDELVARLEGAQASGASSSAAHSPSGAAPPPSAASSPLP